MKLNIPGSQPVIISKLPVLDVHGTNKKYVDNSIQSHEENNNLHLTSEQRTLLTSLNTALPNVAYLAGLTDNVQTQLDSKLSKSGGGLSGFLTLHADPSTALHAVTKQYVDQNLLYKLNLTGGVLSGFITLHTNPTDNLHAATKQYVDSKVFDHASNTDLHVTQTQRQLLDDLTVTSAEINRLSGVTANVQEQLDDKIGITGGAVSGDITLTSGASIYTSKAPALETELVNKAYVDARINGKEWKDPITSSSLLGFSLNTPPASPAEGDTYIAGSAPTGDWFGLAGHPVQFLEGVWTDLYQTRAVQIGDRFGVMLKNTKPVEAELSTVAQKLITITGGTPGNYTFTADDLTPGTSTLVFDKEALDFGYTYTYAEDNTWIITNTSVNLTGGDGLVIQGRFINILTGVGLTIGFDGLRINLNQSSGLTFNVEGKLQLSLDGNSLTATASGVKLSDAIKQVIDDSVTKSGTSSVTGSISIANVGSLKSDATPTANNDVITKVYADTINTNLSAQIQDVETIVNVLNTDPVTKGYVDTELVKYLPLTGGVLTNYLTLSGNPINNLHASTKGYVDTQLLSHTSDSVIHITLAEHNVITSLPDYLIQLNNIGEVNSPVQAQLDDKLSVTGGNMSGPLSLSGDPTIAAHAANKNYVDSQLNSKLSLSGGIMSGYLKLVGDPSADLDAVGLGYLNTRIAAANSYADGVANSKLPLSGGSLTDFLTLHADPTANYHASTKKYVDDSVTTLATSTSISVNLLQNRATALETTVSSLATDPVTKSYVDSAVLNKVNANGGTLTGYLTLHADPVSPLHAASKQYVDTIALGLKPKTSVRLATVTPLLATYDNGSSGVSATLTGNFPGALVVDGKTANVGERILVKTQSFSRENGDYVVDVVGDVGTPFILRRAVTMDEADEINGGYVNVYDGDTLKGTGWVLTVDNPTAFTLGTDAVRINQFFGPGTYIAGKGMTMSGNTFQVNSANTNRITISNDDIDLAISGVVAGTYTKVTVDAYGRATNGSNPTTLAGYGITDAQLSNSKLTSLSGLLTRGLLVLDNSDTPATRKLTISGLGITLNDDATGASSSDLVITSTATSDNTASSLVFRDASGNFSANNITANLTGNATTASTLQTSRNFNIAGDVIASAQPFNGSANLTLTTTLSETGIVAGTYRSVTFDSKGRATGGTNPTTLAGYGITDAQPTSAKLSSITALATRGFLVIDTSDEFKVRKFGVSGVGLGISDDGTADAAGNLILTSNATSLNTASTIVSRDASGNFSAGTVTANLAGNASTATALQTSRAFSIAGDLVASAVNFDGTGNVELNVSLATSGVAPGTYTKVTVNDKGVITSGSNPTTLAEYGITDSISVTSLNEKVAELEAKVKELHAYILSRI